MPKINWGSAMTYAFGAVIAAVAIKALQKNSTTSEYI